MKPAVELERGCPREAHSAGPRRVHITSHHHSPRAVPAGLPGGGHRGPCSGPTQSQHLLKGGHDVALPVHVDLASHLREREATSRLEALPLLPTLAHCMTTAQAREWKYKDLLDLEYRLNAVAKPFRMKTTPQLNSSAHPSICHLMLENATAALACHRFCSSFHLGAVTA